MSDGVRSYLETKILLAFDPAAAEFFLVMRNNDAVLQSFGVSGDAVGCFMAR